MFRLGSPIVMAGGISARLPTMPIRGGRGRIRPMGPSYKESRIHYSFGCSISLCGPTSWSASGWLSGKMKLVT